ncbi:MAG: prepilin-type N-terminal cleavage/methylation domain-containing protein [Nitrospinae bacterium]|nr:prepilin-type N-terminal cleavage/methylation domain-containing protein [Nitrospinota bacterium]
MVYLRTNSGFTLIEIMIAIVILSVALLSMASTSVSVIKGNQVSDRVTEATTLAQDTIEELRNKDFYLGSDGLLGTGDDTISPELSNSNTSNEGITNSVTLFESPDHAYNIDSSGNEDRTNLLNSPPLTTSVFYLRRSWVIQDNIPVANMKTIIVIVGWIEAGLNRYVTVSTVIAGTRFSGMPGTI